MFIYRPIGTQFITDDLREWARDIVRDEFGPAFIELIRQQPREFTSSFQYRYQGESHLPAAPRFVGRIEKE